MHFIQEAFLAFFTSLDELYIAWFAIGKFARGWHQQGHSLLHEVEYKTVTCLALLGVLLARLGGKAEGLQGSQARVLSSQTQKNHGWQPTCDPNSCSTHDGWCTESASQATMLAGNLVDVGNSRKQRKHINR